MTKHGRSGEKDEQRKTSPDAPTRTREPMPGRDNDPQRGGYHHADTEMGTESSEMIAELEKAVTDRGDDSSPDDEAGGSTGPGHEKPGGR